MQEEIFNPKPRLGISTCLLGEKVRYDGGDKKDYFLTKTFGRHVEWVPVCPEVEIGMGIPREAVRLAGDPSKPRMVNKYGVGYLQGQVYLQPSPKELWLLNHV